MESNEITPSLDTPKNGVYQRSIHGGAWYFFDIIGQKAIGFVSFFILARLLAPADYGVISAVFLAFGFLDLLTNPAFGDALTQKKESVEPYLDVQWTFDLIRTSILAVILFFIAPWLATFFNLAPTDVPLMRAAGLLLLIPMFGNVRQIYFFKQLNFRNIFIRDVISQVAFTSVAILYAWKVNASAAALFAGFLAQYVTGTIASYILYPSKPKFSFEFKKLRELLGYSKWVYGQNLADYLLGFLDRILIGRLLEPAALGFYAKAKDLAAMPTVIVTSIISRVGFPAFANIQDKMEKVREGFVKSYDILIMSGVPITLLIGLEGGSIVSVLMGDRWLPLVVPFKIFAFGSLFLAGTRVVNAVFAALGKPKINFQMNALQAVISAPLMYVGIRYGGVNGLAMVMCGIWFLLFGYASIRARAVLNLALRDVLPLAQSGTAAFCVTVALDVVGRNSVHALMSPWADMGWIALLGLTYVAVLFAVSRALGKGPWQTGWSILHELGIGRRAGTA